MGESTRNNDEGLLPPTDLTRNLCWTLQVMPSDWNRVLASNEFTCFFFLLLAVLWRNISWALSIRSRLSKMHKKLCEWLLEPPPPPAMELHQIQRKRDQDVQVIRRTDESNSFYAIVWRFSLEWVCWVSATCSDLFVVDFPPRLVQITNVRNAHSLEWQELRGRGLPPLLCR